MSQRTNLDPGSTRPSRRQIHLPFRAKWVYDREGWAKGVHLRQAVRGIICRPAVDRSTARPGRGRRAAQQYRSDGAPPLRRAIDQLNPHRPVGRSRSY